MKFLAFSIADHHIACCHVDLDGGLLKAKVAKVSPHLNGLKGVLYLEEPSLWTEGIHTTIVLAPCEKHGITSRILASKMLRSAVRDQHVTAKNVSRIPDRLECQRCPVSCASSACKGKEGRTHVMEHDCMLLLQAC